MGWTGAVVFMVLQIRLILSQVETNEQNLQRFLIIFWSDFCYYFLNFELYIVLVYEIFKF